MRRALEESRDIGQAKITPVGVSDTNQRLSKLQRFVPFNAWSPSVGFGGFVLVDPSVVYGKPSDGVGH